MFMNIFTMLSVPEVVKKLTIGNVIKFSNYKSSVLHTELRVSTLVLFIKAVFINRYCRSVYRLDRIISFLGFKKSFKC